MAERVLVIINTIDAGGAETFVMKVFRCLYKNYIFDFLINKKESDFYLSEINKLGGRVYYGFSKSHNILKSMRFTYKTVKQGKYEKIFCIAVHPIGVLDILAARLGGAKLCLTRSTNSNAGGKVSHMLAWVCRPILRFYTDVMLAPSKEAGVWLFGEKAVSCRKVKIIANGIQVEHYKFDEEKRKRKRTQLGLTEKDFVVGHVGRFNRQKNHEKLIEIFDALQRINENAKMILVGDGELRSSIEKKVNRLGLRECVLFLGIQEDVPNLLMAMDVFVFPSLYEGMPNAVIEAQATGLPCVVSNTISSEVKLLDTTFFLSNSDTDSKWAQKCLCSSCSNNNRMEASQVIISKGYSIDNTAKQIAMFLKGK